MFLWKNNYVSCCRQVGGTHFLCLHKVWLMEVLANDHTTQFPMFWTMELLTNLLTDQHMRLASHCLGDMFPSWVTHWWGLPIDPCSLSEKNLLLQIKLPIWPSTAAQHLPKFCPKLLPLWYITCGNQRASLAASASSAVSHAIGFRYYLSWHLAMVG